MKSPIRSINTIKIKTRYDQKMKSTFLVVHKCISGSPLQAKSYRRGPSAASHLVGNDFRSLLTLDYQSGISSQ